MSGGGGNFFCIFSKKDEELDEIRGEIDYNTDMDLIFLVQRRGDNEVDSWSWSLAEQQKLDIPIIKGHQFDTEEKISKEVESIVKAAQGDAFKVVKQEDFDKESDADTFYLVTAGEERRLIYQGKNLLGEGEGKLPVDAKNLIDLIAKAETEIIPPIIVGS